MAAESYIQLMEECWAGNPEDRPKSFEAIVPRLEAMKKQLHEWRLARASAGAKKSSEDAPSVKRTVSEPEVPSRPQMANNNETPPPPKSPAVAAMPIAEDIPASPFDRDSADEGTAVQEQQGNDFPVSPFN